VKKVAIALVCVLLLPALASAQVCSPQYVWGGTGWSNDTATRMPSDADPQVTANTNTHHVFSPMVPQGRIYKMRTISVSSLYTGGSAEYMIEHLVVVPPYQGHYYHAIARGVAVGTPVLYVAPADASALIMQAGERLGARANGGTSSTMAIALFWSAWSFPAECLPRLLGVEVSDGSGSATTPPPDFSALVQAASDAATSLAKLSASVPPQN
jgi:hypothetical protein